MGTEALLDTIVPRCLPTAGRCCSCVTTGDRPVVRPGPGADRQQAVGPFAVEEHLEFVRRPNAPRKASVLSHKFAIAKSR